MSKRTVPDLRFQLASPGNTMTADRKRALLHSLLCEVTVLPEVATVAILTFALSLVQ